ncbi:MAG: CehA/McbA family metallohydrolase, partial [Myxococcales bacterium]|nr:CehA/McbA family metallohydrolase [Myxococcales bacterium]
HELYEGALEVATRYTLRPAERGLLIETTLVNVGRADITLPALGDAIQWGGAEKFAPGKTPGFTGDSTGAFVGGLGRFTSYAVAAVDGDITATSGGGWTDTLEARQVRLPPGGHAEYGRVLLVGERPDTSSLAAALRMAAGDAVGRIEARLSPAGALPTGAVLRLAPEGGGDVLTLAKPFAGRVPAGRYHAFGPGRGAASEPPVVDVAPGSVARVAVPVEPPASVDLTCVTAPGTTHGPCKLTFEGLAGTSTPDFGPAHAAGPARNQVTTADGSVRLSLLAGRYRITASRGPEYSLASVERDLASGERRSETFSLSRVVDTTGYLACDFHQHSMFSADAPVSAKDRVIANVAEGVEIAVASEHNVISDLQAVVRDLALERELVEISGVELTSDASRHPWGHANVFPLVAAPGQPSGGAPRVRDRLPKDLFSELRAAGERAGLAGQVVQINHPRSGKNGYFDLLGFDRQKGRGLDPAYEAGFDALEVWNGRNVEGRDAVLEDLRALLASGRPVTATANTDTHGIVGQEAGYPRTYVRVADDGHLEAWDAARVADLVHGLKDLRDVVLTNGPMLRVTLGGSPIGGIARARQPQPEGARAARPARPAEVTLRVHVECAPWVEVDHLEVIHVAPLDRPSGRDGEDLPLVLAPLSSGALGADLALAVHVERDDAVFVVVRGSRPLTPVLAPSGVPMSAWAMTGATWIDADGDGRSLSR